MPTSTYTFIDKDILNTALHPHGLDNNMVSYTVKTTYRAGLVGPKVTTFTPSAVDDWDSMVGEINWKAQMFSIGGLAVRWEDLRTKPHGVTDRSVIAVLT
ncbi:hypothetical protein DXG03_009458 [Asterophora parasitica]|uniref:Uncharacterized protein n=1 Tax=Asterophora parasitica TaxID=117018 RepID=A0A9P7KH70_9AGAR|nr:hypothetical protein DXG03_009458 [Asterophora parasitica]